MGSRAGERDGASPGKIFVGGLHRDTDMATFQEHFGRYGKIIDAVIMEDRYTRKPRGFGFITYDDPSVVDRVIQDNHVIKGKQVEIKRTIPKGSAQTNDLKTRKIFVGGIPNTVSEDDLKIFFSKIGKVVEHEIIRDHMTNRPRGFGFVVFDSEKVVDDLIAKGNMIDFGDTKVEIKKAEPKRLSNAPPAYGNEPKNRAFGDGFGGYGGSYGAYGAGPVGAGSYGASGGFGSRLGSYGSGYGGGSGELGASYTGLSSGFGIRRGDSPFGYSSRFGAYGSGLGSAHGSSFGREYGFSGYGGSSYSGGYDSGTGAGYGSGAGYGRSAGAGYGPYAGADAGSGGIYGSRTGGYGSGSGRYHPYGR